MCDGENCGGETNSWYFIDELQRVHTTHLYMYRIQNNIWC